MKKHLLNLIPVIILLITSLNLLVGQPINPNPIESMVIPYVNSQISIDGILDDAYPGAIQLTNKIIWDQTGYSGSTDHSVEYRMCWGDSGIFLFASITDDVEQGQLNWDQDGIEIKINPDKSNDGPNYLWKDDALEIGIERSVEDLFRYHIVDPIGDGQSANNDTITSGPRMGFGLPGLTFAIINGETAYTIETYIPWLFILPVGTTEEVIPEWTAKEMGFDIHCADNDNDTKGRTHAYIWDADGTGTEADAANVNTSLLGNITFGPRISGITDKKLSDYPMYPNPAKDIVNINNLENITSIEIVNVFGQPVKFIEVASSDITVNLSGLKNTIYYVNMKNKYGNIVSTRILIVR